MIIEGTYDPKNEGLKAIREVANGTFGGRIQSMNNGRFVFIAYTD